MLFRSVRAAGPAALAAATRRSAQQRSSVAAAVALFDAIPSQGDGVGLVALLVHQEAFKAVLLHGVLVAGQLTGPARCSPAPLAVSCIVAVEQGMLEEQRTFALSDDRAAGQAVLALLVNPSI